MPASNYEIWLTNDYGVRLQLLNNIISGSFTREANRIAPFSLALPATFDTSLIRVPDRMVQLWRAPSGGVLGLWRTYFVRKWIPETRGGLQIFTIGGPDTNDLLRRRIAKVFSGTDVANKSDEADDMMKDLVTYSMIDAIAPLPDAGTRAWADLTVQVDTSSGPALVKSVSFKSLLLPSGGGIISTLADAAKEAGAEVFFEISHATVTGNSINFEFRTTIGQPGMDRTTSGVQFSQEQGNLANPFFSTDYSQSENYVYAGGQRQSTAREIQQAYDAARYNLSQWNLCETFADARRESTPAGVLEKANEALFDGKPRQKFTAQPLDTASSRFGIDWDFGDKVRAKFNGEEFDTIIRSVTISLDSRGNENISARLDYES